MIGLYTYETTYPQTWTERRYYHNYHIFFPFYTLTPEIPLVQVLCVSTIRSRLERDLNEKLNESSCQLISKIQFSSFQGRIFVHSLNIE